MKICLQGGQRVPKGYLRRDRKFRLRPAQGISAAGLLSVSIFVAMLAISLLSFTASADFIAGQTFDGLNDTATETFERVPSNTELTSGSSHDANPAAGIPFSTFWVNSRGYLEGPVLSISDPSDFIGINSDGGLNAPNINPFGVGVQSKIEQNFIFNDGDGRYELVFEPVDLSGFTNQEVSFYYWINNTSYENTDFFTVTLTDGLNTMDVLSFTNIELEANRSDDDGTPNWNLFTADVGNLITNFGWDETQIQLIIKADTNSNEENIFVDEILFSGDTILVSDFGDAPAPFPGAEHTGGSGLQLGAKFNMEAGDQPDPQADLDTSDDGVRMPGFLTEGDVPIIKVVVQNPLNRAAFISAWIDIDGDGVWEDEEQATQAILTEGISSEPVVIHSAAVSTISVPAESNSNITIAFPQIPTGTVTAIGGTTYARFRVSTDADSIATPTGLAPDGEVEDYIIVLSKPANAVFIPNQLNLIMQQSITGFGTRVRYDITIRNLTTQSQADNPGAEFENTLPPGVTYVADSAKASSGNISFSTGANAVRWNGAVPAGGEVLLQYVVQVVSGSLVAAIQEIDSESTSRTEFLATREKDSDSHTSLPWAILLGSLYGGSLLCMRHRKATLGLLVPVLLVLVTTGCTGVVPPVGTITSEICNQAVFNFDSDGDNVNDLVVLSEDPLTEELYDPTCVRMVP